MTYDTVQEWNFVGTTRGTGHLMHTHVCHQQICGTGKYCTEICGFMMEYGQFIDNVKIDNTNNDPCYTRFKTVRFSGKVILHCHDLMHEDVGMMGWVDTFGGPENLLSQPEASIYVVLDEFIWTINWLKDLNYEPIACTSSTHHLVCSRNVLGQTVSSYG